MRKIIALVLVLGLAFSLSTPNTAYAKKSSKKLLDIVPVTVDSTGYRTAVVTSDGALWMWGSSVASENPWYQYTPIKLIDKDVVSVSCSSYFTAVIKTDGSLWMWGSNTSGELGLGTKSVAGVDKPTKIMDNVAMVSCGANHTAVIKTDGSLWLFGDNYYGQIGNGYVGDASIKEDWHETPIEWPIQMTPVKIMDNVVSVSCGGSLTAAIKEDGSLWWWGEIGKRYANTTPTKILTDVTSVSCGYAHAAALKKDGSLWTWGINGSGCLGVGSAVIKGEDGFNATRIPTKIMDDVAEVRCAYWVTAAIKEDRSLWMCGMSLTEDVVTPVKVMDKCSLFAPGNEGLIVITVKRDGSLYGWGDKMSLGLGYKGEDIQTKPVKIISNVMIPDVPSATTRQEVNEAIDAKLVPKKLQKNYGKLITRDGLEKLLTQLIKKVGGDANAREILTDSDGTFSPKGKVTESRFVTVIKRTAKALGVKYKSFGLKRSKTKLTTERAIVMIYRAYKMLKKK